MGAISSRLSNTERADARKLADRRVSSETKRDAVAKQGAP